MNQVQDKLYYPQLALKIIVFFLLFMSQQFCTNTTSGEKSNEPKSEIKKVINIKPSSSFSDTIVIDFPSAVFYNPDSIQLEKIKAITDTMIYESSVHEYFYQMKYSRNVIQKNWPWIKIIEIRNIRYILFKSTKGKAECIDLNTKNDFCGIFLFDDNKKPKQADMTNIDSELGFYFSK